MLLSRSKSCLRSHKILTKINNDFTGILSGVLLDPLGSCRIFSRFKKHFIGSFIKIRFALTRLNKHWYISLLDSYLLVQDAKHLV